VSTKKNISGGPLDVPLLDRVVEDGEVVEVPDFQPASTEEDPLPIVWPENRWEDVAPAKPAKADTKASAKTADDTSGKAAG
jgi:hypothetical protein